MWNIIFYTLLTILLTAWTITSIVMAIDTVTDHFDQRQARKANDRLEELIAIEKAELERLKATANL